ncbi:MAG: recombinase family protein [Planctomycetes bacterium]|nr:recombinase family protein [Planctomycetota bacterium]
MITLTMNGDGKLPSGARCALYARVSSETQAHEMTIDSQVSLLRERIAADGGRVEPALSFLDDGVSGATLVRPGLERLRDQAAAGGMDRLYVLAPDRLARRHVHQLVLVEELQASGVEVVFVNRPVSDTPEDQLLLQVQGVIAEYERAKILERTRRGRVHAARCGRISVLGRAPYGYRYLAKHTGLAGPGVAAYEVLEDEARVVRQIFDWVGREGCSLREVGRRLKNQGVRTCRGLTHWTTSTLSALLKNSAYRGQAAYGKTRQGERRRLRPRRGAAEVPKKPHGRERRPPSEQIFIPVPALIDDDLFAVVQERLEENRRCLRAQQAQRTAGGSSYFLQGLAVCGLCGYAMYGSSRCGRKKDRSYNRCVGRDGQRFAGRRVCDNPMSRTADLDAAVWQAIMAEQKRKR